MSEEIQKEAPTIELYMYSLNQEFPVGKGHQSFLKRFAQLQQDVTGKLVRQASVEGQVYRVPVAALSPGLEPPDWAAEWVGNQWIENYTAAAGIGVIVESDPMRNAIMREEDFGAILFEPGSDRVFKLNVAGAELFGALRREYLAGDKALEPRAMSGFTEAQVGHFIGYLKAAGLWGRT